MAFGVWSSSSFLYVLFDAVLENAAPHCCSASSFPNVYDYVVIVAHVQQQMMHHDEAMYVTVGGLALK